MTKERVVTMVTPEIKARIDSERGLTPTSIYVAHIIDEYYKLVDNK